ncbi:MAG: hypothetical protein ACI3V1_06700 [Faecousia sp.]
MSVNLKPYVYKKGENPALDEEFSGAEDYGQIRPGKTAVFWRSALRWHVVSLSEVQRIFRRVVPVYGKLCCGGHSFIMERLVLILKDGTELDLYIGDDMEPKAAALLKTLQDAHPEILFGKPKAE